ncbi:uncharacterized protein LOC132269273 [Cornus florida]|uniref:uncharacterized protein LOC132269273 n=1 Tax=Cornus florida TaxID=4283 RepID=UPI00289DFDB4|nr:uncharacterized protein LOC132269273 [Cornus florida]
MARWDEILSLPVQNPPTLEFSSVDLVWSKVEGWRDNIDRVALIPFARVDDFVRGESANKDCPTRFHVEARRRRPPEMVYKLKVDGILEYILYWCSFGPDDHRKGGVVRPSRSTYVPKKKSAGRPNTKRGCTCHFIVKRLIAEPSVALIIYNQDKHVDKKGLPCHGPQDKKAAGTRAMYAPYISEDLRLRVLSLLYVGVSVETIMQRHNESVEKQGGPCNRDDLLTHRYVRRQERSIRRSTYELDADDAVSVSMWVESHQSQVFFYEDFSDSDPFVLGIQTEWQLQQMIRFGNRGLVASDSRFGTNKLKYPVLSLVVFNSDNKAIPVAWIIAPKFASIDGNRWMRALYNRVRSKDPTWKLAGFIVDDPFSDVLTIREVFQCSVLLCFWRVRHAWHKNLVQRCSEIEMRVEISRRLGQAVYNICRGHGTVDLFEDFMEDFIDASDFMDYFKAVWYPKIGFWSTALKSLPLASQETCAAMEFYHNQLKLRLVNEKDSSVYQRADWLVDKLGTKVHSYFWLDEYSGKDDFTRYWKDEWLSGLTSWRKSLKISDSDVVMEGKCAKVIDQEDRNRAHVIWNPGSEYAICDCSWAEMGNLCEHVFKIIKVCRDKGCSLPSTCMFQYHQALVKMLHCPPHDSLIRDHAVSLAIWVQMQLNAQVDLDNSHTNVDPAEQQIVGPVVIPSQDRDVVNEIHGNKENIPHTEDGSPDCITGDLVGDLINHCDSFTEMEVDPSSIHTSASRLFSIDGVVSADVTENGDSVLIDAGIDITRNFPSADDLFKNLNGFDDDIMEKDTGEENMMDLVPQSEHVPLSTTESLEQCTRIHQNDVCSNDAEPSAIPNVENIDPKSNNISLHLRMPVNPQLVDMVEASSVNKESGGADLQRENGSTIEKLSPKGDHVSSETVQDNMVEDSNLCDVAHRDGSLMEMCPKAIQDSSSKSVSSEQQPLVELATHGAEISAKLSSSDKKCGAQNGVADNGCHDEAISQHDIVNVANDTLTKGNISGKCAHVSPARTNSNEHQNAVNAAVCDG